MRAPTRCLCSGASFHINRQTASVITAPFKSFFAYSTESSKKPAISQKVKFIDQLRVTARGGQGGGGSNALFGRTGHHPRAAGGSGAAGGSVLLRATRQLTGLGSIPLHVEAARGGSGGKQWMDGKRGADKVVPVPLGTMVWRLVQLRGPEGTHSPHGVTPLLPDQSLSSSPAAAAAQHHLASQQDGSRQVQGMPNNLASSSSSSSSSSNSSSQHRRRLFQDDQSQLGEAAEAAGTASSPAASSQQHMAPAGNGIGSSQPSGTNSDSSGMHACAGSVHDDAEETTLSRHYEDLVSCKLMLSNREKLNLLHYGSLQGPPAGALVALQQTVYEQDGEDDDDDDDEEEDDDDDDATADGDGSDDVEDDMWETQQQQQQLLADEWRGMGEHGEVEGRYFDKQQVWSILAAQAELLAVLESEGQELLVAQGGRGGRGNATAPSQHNRPASRARSDGQPGQEVLLWLQLRLMADVALVGLPNVGKSSLIAALTGARAQVGSYAFTTLRPQLGALLPAVPDTGEPAAVGEQQHMEVLHAAAAPPPLQSADRRPSNSSSGSSTALTAAAAAAVEDDSGLTGHKLLLADLPGLVPGAHLGKGRGIDFLKHLHKARCIALVVDVTGRAAGTGSAEGHSSIHDSEAGVQHEGDDDDKDGWQPVVPHSPEEQLGILLDELRCFDSKTMVMPMLIVANKVDALSPQQAAAVVQRLKAATSLPIIPVSAAKHLGLPRLKQSLQLLAGGAGD